MRRRKASGYAHRVMASEAFESIVQLMAANSSMDLPLLERRAALEEGAAALPPPPGTSFEEIEAGGVPAEWVTASGVSDDRVLLYLHGGAYTICSPRTHRRITAALSKETGVRVLAADYRLAPEHPFPAAVEDALAVYRWLLGNGHAAARVAVVGDSAGGGLAVAMLLAARDAGLPMPAAAVTISPWADLVLDSESLETKADVDPMLSRERLTQAAGQYLGGADAADPKASPVYADMRGLPPLLVHVGGREILLDDAKRLAQRAEQHGVDVTLEVEEEMIHVWHILAGLTPEGDEGIRRVAAFLREHLALEVVG